MDIGMLLAGQQGGWQEACNGTFKRLIALKFVLDAIREEYPNPATDWDEYSESTRMLLAHHAEHMSALLLSLKSLGLTEAHEMVIMLMTESVRWTNAVGVKANAMMESAGAGAGRFSDKARAMARSAMVLDDRDEEEQSAA